MCRRELADDYYIRIKNAGLPEASKMPVGERKRVNQVITIAQNRWAEASGLREGVLAELDANDFVAAAEQIMYANQELTANHKLADVFDNLRRAKEQATMLFYEQPRWVEEFKELEVFAFHVWKNTSHNRLAFTMPPDELWRTLKLVPLEESTIASGADAILAEMANPRIAQ